MTKKHDTNEPKEVIEKTDWQKLHEEFVARQAVKNSEEEEVLAEETEQIMDEFEDSLTEERQSEDGEEDIQDVNSEEDFPTDEEDDDETVEEPSDVKEEVVKPEEPAPTPKNILKEEKTLKKQLKEKAKTEKKEQRLKNRPLRVARLKVASIIVVAVLTLVCSGFILSPYSKEKQFEVTGLEHADKASILVSTGIKQSDYISSVYFEKESIEKAIHAANPWVKKAEIIYHFPNTFEIAITENRIIAYAQTESGYQPVLENGLRMPVVSKADLPENFLTVNLTDEKAVQSFVAQLANLDEDLVSRIKVVNAVTNATTKDLLLLEVKEGHQIRVPLSQLDVKLPFYSKIAETLTAPSIIDMEVGIYTTNETIEAIMAQEKAEREEAKKKAEEEAKKKNKKTDGTADANEEVEGAETLSEEASSPELTETVETDTTQETSTESTTH